MPESVVEFKVRETVVLRKYDGDPPREGEVKEPVETLIVGDVTHVVRDGRVVETITHEG